MMTQITLTPRLACIAKLVPAQARFADIGTDHGYLPIFLLDKQQVHSAIASDLREGPLTTAKQNAAHFHCGTQLSFRLGAGLSQISPEECDTIAIAGMGGETIAQILADAPWTASGKHLLLLQPMTMLPSLRQFLWANSYQIERESICFEGKRMYLVLSVRGGVSHAQARDLSDCYFSPALLCDPNAKLYLQKLLQQESMIFSAMSQATQPDLRQLAQQDKLIHHLQNALEELLC